MNIFLLVLIFILVAYIFYLRLSERKHKVIGEKYLFQIEQKEEYALSLEKLLSYLMGIQELGISTTPLESRQEIYQKILSYACQLVNSDKGTLLIFDEESNEMNFVAKVGANFPEFSNSGGPKGGHLLREGFAGKILQESKAIFVEDSERDSRFLNPEERKYYPRCFASVPLKAKRGTIGIINISLEGDPYPAQKMNLISILAGQSAITLENVELYQNLQIFYFETVQTLSRAIDAKDAYTWEHADRSRRYARSIAQEMNLPEIMAKNIEYAALLHDVGKIGIEESILGKPGKLTDEEKESVRKHPTIGKKLLAPISLLAPVVPMILYHHEWYNGQGYLEGLKGEEIPIGARIVALIDAWDAMTSDRPYRKALSREAATEEINKSSGTQFDPKVVEAFLRVLEKNNVG